MVRRAFYSFHYKNDNWRAAKVRNIGRIEGNNILSDNEWETVKAKGSQAVENWINGQLDGKSCTIVLIGSETASRKWVKYEIEESWKRGKGLIGIHIHNILDRDGYSSVKGKNPFSEFSLRDTPLSSIVKTYDPPYSSSSNVYHYIKENIEKWVEDSVAIRKRYP